MAEAKSGGRLRRFASSVWAEKAKWGLRLLWAGVILIAIVLPLAIRKGEPPKGKLEHLVIYSQNRERYAYWERKDAIGFGLAQVDSSINYLFIAAGGVLSIILKLLIDPVVEPKEGRKPIPQAVKSTLLNAAFGCLLSIACGFLARLYFASLADSEYFSIYEEVGLAAFGQVLAFVIAASLMFRAAIALVNPKSES